MTKKELRQHYKKLRANLTEDQIERHSLEIANQALKIPVWDRHYYHLFLSIAHHKEVDTSFLMHILHGKDKNIVVSRSDMENGSMTHFLLTDQTKIKQNAWGIPEPQNGLALNPSILDVVFIPLLAFDRGGHRVGYGKGFYDRFLKQCKPDVIKIGLSFFDAETQIDDSDVHDVTLNYCITPSSVYRFDQ